MRDCRTELNGTVSSSYSIFTSVFIYIASERHHDVLTTGLGIVMFSWVALHNLVTSYFDTLVGGTIHVHVHPCHNAYLFSHQAPRRYTITSISHSLSGLIRLESVLFNCHGHLSWPSFILFKFGLLTVRWYPHVSIFGYCVISIYFILLMPSGPGFRVRASCCYMHNSPPHIIFTNHTQHAWHILVF